MVRIHAAIAERAGEQLGLITIDHLRALGVSDRQRRRLAGNGVLGPVSARVYRHAGWPDTTSQRRLAAVWAAGAGAVASHMAAAAIWGFDGIDDGAVEVSVLLPRNPRPVPGRVHRVHRLDAVDTTQRGLIPLTTAARTLLDIAPRVTLEQLEEALDGACRRGQIHLSHLIWRLAELRRQGVDGLGKVDALLEHARRERGEESWLESAFLRILRDAGLPLPRLQVTTISGADGPRYRLDGTYDEHGLVVEIDGHSTHATRRQRQADAERDMRLQAAGQRVIRFTYEDIVERPDHVATTLAMFLGITLPVGASPVLPCPPRGHRGHLRGTERAAREP